MGRSGLGNKFDNSYRIRFSGAMDTKLQICIVVLTLRLGYEIHCSVVDSNT